MAPPSVLAPLWLFPDNCYLYVPFSTIDLYNRKNQNPAFNTSSDFFISLNEFIFFNHLPTCDNCQPILYTLFTTKERGLILMKATEAPSRLASMADGWRAEVIDPALPRRRPQWNYNTERGRRSLGEYHQVLLEGMKWAAQKATYLSKVTGVKQGPAFLECLLYAYWLYTPTDPEDLENLKAINLATVTQSVPDIHRKIQKMDVFSGKNRSEILEIF